MTIWNIKEIIKLDEEYHILEKYANQISKDTDGKFDAIIKRGFDNISLYVCNTKNPNYHVKFIELLRNDKPNFPSKLILSIDPDKRNTFFTDIKHFEEVLKEYIKSDVVSIALGKFLHVF